MMLFRSDLILDWSGQPEGKILKFLDRFCGIKVINVATQDYTSGEFGAYCSLIWKYLTSSAERTRILEEQRDRFRTVAEEIAKKDYACSCVFGAGPSIDSASDFSYDKTLTIGCDTIIRNEALLDRIQPVFICAADSVNHLGVSIYASEFRRDLLKVLKERDLYFVTTAGEGALLLMHYPEIEQKVILIDQCSDGPVYDLVADFGAPRLDGVLNILMLPLAATFSKDIWVLGCEGKSAAGDNEDFWPRASTAESPDLVDSAHRCHPTFDVLSQMSAYEAFVQSTQTTIKTGERERGLRYHGMSRSAIPALDSRCVDWHEIDKAGFSRPYRLAEVGKIAEIKDIVPRE